MGVRIQREEALLARSFGEEWTRYAARTPRFGI
jgi:protein-S-isoprenylcysteine O-methyltransferase Ste14